VAFAYFVHWRATRRAISVGAFVALAIAAVTPTIANEALSMWKVPGVHHLWTHSLVVPLGLWAVWFVLGFAPVPSRVLQWLFAFALGYTTHLASEPLFDMLHLVLSVRTTDVGTSWLFPFYNVVVTGPQLEPGFYLVWWQVGLEAVALVAALWHWQRVRRRERLFQGPRELQQEW
jgi:hypothetical protein